MPRHRTRGPTQEPTQPPSIAPDDDRPQGGRQALETQMAGAPLAGAPIPPGGPVTTARPAGAPGGPPLDPASLFAPTEQPNVPIVGGNRGQIIPSDPDMLLRQIQMVYPHPDVVRLARGISDSPQ